MRKILLSLTLLCTAGGLMGRDITGVVKDSDGPVPGADVVVQGSDTNYETTDENGEFTISVETGDVLEISSMGYANKTVKIDSRDRYEIKLAQEAQELKEVTVTGDYGKQKKEDLTGSTSQVDGAKLTSAPTPSVENALAGKVSGLRVSASSGQPGQASTVQIRGLGSLTGSNEPLYVVDGMPINGGGKTAANDNPLASINQNDILSIEVLKDASATAIYGARAANGVVMITTKRGKNTKEENQESSSISYAGQFSVASVTDKLDLMNLQEFASYYTDPYVAAAYNQNVDKELVALAKYGGQGTDWQDEIFRTAISHSHQVSLTGGTDKTQYALSLGYMNQDGILVNTDFERFNSRLNLENQVKSWLRVGLNMAYTHMTQTKQSGFDFPDDNKLSGIGAGAANEEAVYVQSLISSPATSPVDFNGEYTDLGSDDQEIKINPLREANYSPIFLKKNNVTGQTFFAINLTKDLNWRNTFGIDYSASGESRYRPAENAAESNQQEFINRENMYYRFCSTLNYVLPQPKESKHKMNALLGYEAWKAMWEGISTRKSNYLDNYKFIDKKYQNANLGDKEGIISGYKGEQSMMSVFARVNYTFNRRYLVTATGRFDGSSTLAPENRWGFFPSFSLAWNADQELFMKKITAKKKITQLKLRAGWGQTGNAGNNMGYIGSYKSVNTQYGMGKVYGTWLNPDLIWETNWQINAGLDASFFKNRLNLTFDAFYKQNNDLIVKAEPGPSLASTANSYLYTQVPDINAGSIKNVGFDVTLTSTNIQKELGGKDFTWNTDVNFSFVRNEVVKLQSDSAVLEGKQSFKTATRTYCVSRVGHAPGLFWGFKTNGLIQNTDQLKSIKQRPDATDVGDFDFVDINSDGAINEADKTYIGDPNPDFTFGLGNTLNWGPWSLNIFLTGSYGNDVYNLLRSKLEGMDRGGINQLKTVLNCARVETTVKDGQEYKYITNSSTNIPRPNSVAEGRNVANVVSDRYVEDASYVRIQSIGLSYAVPFESVKKIGLNNMRVSFNVQNVATFTKYSGLNPEVPNVSAINQGVDTGSYPLSRSYVVGLNFDF